MEYIKQIFRFIELGRKQFLIIAVSSWALYFSSELYPDRFDRISEWVMPTILIFGIASVASYIFVVLYDYLANINDRFPINIIIYACKKWSIRKNLFQLELDQVEILVRAVANESRTIRLNPDKKSVLLMEKNGLIIRNYYSFDGVCYRYEIHNYAWEQIITMNEFNLTKEAKEFFKNKRDLYTGYSKINTESIISQLPKLHPSVISFKERVRKTHNQNDRS